MRIRKWLLTGVVLTTLSGCFGSDPEFYAGVCEDAVDNDWPAGPWIEDCVRLNEIQTLGTHNSYRQVPLPEVLAAIADFAPDAARELEYTHRPLSEQLDELGIRQFELDVFADPEGGHYADPRVLQDDTGIEDPGFDRETMLAPGYKVLHVQDIDYRANCFTLVSCLEEIRVWSEANPDHLPIMILVEVKSSPVPVPAEVAEQLDFVEPVAITPTLLDDLDAEIRSVFSAQQVITPDDVRGEYGSLYEAIQRRGWPTLADSRGKVLFALDNFGGERSMYLDNHPNLEGAVMFTSAEPPAPTAGFVKRNGPQGSNLAEIQDLVAQGMVVRTRADTPTNQVRSGDITRSEAALMSGAQWVSTDYPEPNQLEETLFPDEPFTDYMVELPGGGVARCNPVRTWPGCDDDLLESQ